MTNQDTQFPVYFGYSDVADHPADAIEGARQVMVAMSDLLAGYRDPYELGENPNSDVRSGIQLVFKACSMQLEAATQQIAERENEAQTLDNIPDNFDFDRLSPADKVLVLCRMNGLTFDAIREGAALASSQGDAELRLRFDRTVTPDMGEDARTQFTITEPVEPSTERQSA